jgi:hypothetical protein
MEELIAVVVSGIESPSCGRFLIFVDTAAVLAVGVAVCVSAPVIFSLMKLVSPRENAIATAPSFGRICMKDLISGTAGIES